MGIQRMALDNANPLRLIDAPSPTVPHSHSERLTGEKRQRLPHTLRASVKESYTVTGFSKYRSTTGHIWGAL